MAEVHKCTAPPTFLPNYQVTFSIMEMQWLLGGKTNGIKILKVIKNHKSFSGIIWVVSLPLSLVVFNMLQDTESSPLINTYLWTDFC